MVLWELFYNFYIPEATHNILQSHAADLFSASQSVELWASSSYGKFIRFVDRATLQQLQHYWQQYASSNEWPQARSAIAERRKEIGDQRVITGVRSAGPFWIEAVEVMAQAYTKYWETGVVGGNASDLSRLNGIGKVNPMFAVSSAASGKFSVHYGTEPMLGFHLAEAFEKNGPTTSRNKSGLADDIVRIAKAQFEAWCNNLGRYIENNHIILDFFCGEALALSHELQLGLTHGLGLVQDARTYTKPWNGTPLVVNGLVKPGSYLGFLRTPYDVIDTSNLGDHVGAINILTATAPLLAHSPSATLYTESLLMASENISSSLTAVLGSDVATFSILIGLIPAGLMTGATMEATGNENGYFTVWQSDATARQFRMRTSWKRPEYADSATLVCLKCTKQCRVQAEFEANDLASLLFEIYKAMFSHEDPTKMMANMARLTTGHYSDSLHRYTRAGFVALLRLVRTEVHADWDRTMTVFNNLLNADKLLIVGSNSLQELYMHLHLYGVYTNDLLWESPYPLHESRPKSGERGILAEDRIPPVICLVLVVPREKLKIFTAKNPDNLGTPGLHMSVTQGHGEFQYENEFFSFQAFFGTLLSRREGTEVSILEEDSNGWRGSADLIVSCSVPSAGLLMGPKNGIRIALMVNSTLDAIMKFSHLGPRMVVFESGLDDTHRVFLCREAPDLKTISSLSTLQREWKRASTASKASSYRTLVKMSNEYRATHFSNRLNFEKGSPESEALATGAAVTVDESSPNTAFVRIGQELQRQLAFPFPVRGSIPKIRVARKSSWIEVQVPLFTALDGDRFDSWTQIVLDNHQRPVCWSSPRVNLEVQPHILFAKKTDSSWLERFMGTALSDTERSLANQDVATTTNHKVDLKQSLNIIFQAFAGRHPQSRESMKVFQLSLVGTKNCHTIILASSLRHDLDLGSIVMEAYVLPLTIPRVMELQSTLARLQEKNPCGVALSEKEAILWRRMLPALAERCRTWKHKSTCEYRTQGVPFSTKEGESPLCSCGEGQISGTELAKVGMKDWAPLAKYVTRIALAPIFPVPYVEPCMSDIRTKISNKEFGNVANSRTASTRCDNCNKSDGSFKTCGGCGKVKYCGPSCQKAAWKEHKPHCTKS